MIKCAIFDLDGTLVDSMKYWETAAADFLNTVGVKAEEGLSKKFLSMSLPESADYMIENYSLHLSNEEVCKGVDEVMKKRYEKDVELKPYFKELLGEFKKLGIRMAVATSTDRPLVEICLKRLGIRKYFDFLITSTEVGESKKSPLIYETCAEFFDAPYNKSFVFEDLPYGIISSGKAGFHTVGLYDAPSEMHQELIKKNAEFYFKEFNMDSVTKLVALARQL